MANDSKWVVAEQDYSPSCTCPKCGGKMTPGVYYVAQRGDTSVKVDNSEIGLGRVSKTYTTGYSNIRKKTGGICMKCWNDEYKSSELICLVIGIIAAVIFGVCLYVVIANSQGLKEKAQTNVLPSLLVAAGILAGAPIAWKALMEALTYHRMIGDMSPDHPYTVSSNLVTQLKQQNETHCQQNEEVLSQAAVELMQNKPFGGGF